MGAAPPRQTEFRFQLPGPVDTQLIIALNAFSAFNFPEIPLNIKPLLQQLTNGGIRLSLIFTSDGFVKLGILFPQPNPNVTLQLIEECRKTSTSVLGTDIFNQIQSILGTNMPDFLEFQYLQNGYGYNVYKEGFNLFLHYKIC